MKLKIDETPPAKMAPLDMLDRALLYWLDRDSRMSIPALAHRVHASPPRVRYRIAQLVQRGAIRSFVTIIDYRLLGWRAYTMYYKLREMTPARLSRLLTRLQRDPRVLDIFLTDGTFDVQVAFLALHMDEAAEVMGGLREQLEPHIIEERLTVQLRSYAYPLDVLLGRTATEIGKPEFLLDIHDKPIELNETDQKLLQAFSSHADWPVWKLAKAVGLTGPTAYARIKRLEKLKIILGYSIVADPNLPGFSRYRILVKRHHLTEARQRELVRFLYQLPQVFRATFDFGDYDLHYDLVAPDGNERRAVMRQVEEQFSREIIRQDWVRVNSILKFNYYLNKSK